MPTPPIYQLDPDVIDHIAAGEVVERPASVAKELVENALDAGARLVQVDLQGGGLERMTVTDDGHGMTPQDARRCMGRHTTSKLRTSADLFQITSLGFRGEALSSIASIARVTLTTRPAGASQGFCLEVHGGSVVRAEAVGCPPGTCVDVQDLFFKTPARRKFMRAPATEQAHAVEAGLRVALGHAHMGLVVTAGHRRLVDIPEGEVQASGKVGGNLQRRVTCALGHRLGPLTAIHHTEAGVTLTGFISAPQLARSDTRGLWLFVNGRFVRDRMLQRAVLDAFQSQRPGRFPTVVLWLRIDPQAVDVNVHPQKLEVRFAEAHGVYCAVGQAMARAAIAQAGAGAGAVTLPINQTSRAMASPLAQASGAATSPKIQISAAALMVRPSQAAQPVVQSSQAAQPVVQSSQAAQPVVQTPHGAVGPWDQALRIKTSPARFLAKQAAPATAATPSRQAKQPQLPFGGTFAQMVPVATQMPGYVLGRCGAALAVVDMGAAARQLAADALARQRQAGALVQHTLMLPPTFVAHPAWAQRLAACWENLTTWGLELDLVGPDQYAIRAVPEALVNIDPVALVMACLDVVLRMGELHDEAAVQRCVEARWLDRVVAEATGVAPAGEVEARNQTILQALGHSGFNLESADFVRPLVPENLAPLFVV